MLHENKYSHNNCIKELYKNYKKFEKQKAFSVRFFLCVLLVYFLLLIGVQLILFNSCHLRLETCDTTVKGQHEIKLPKLCFTDACNAKLYEPIISQPQSKGENTVLVDIQLNGSNKSRNIFKHLVPPSKLPHISQKSS